MKKLLLSLLFILALPTLAQATTYWTSVAGGAGTCGAASGTTDPGTYRTLTQGIACLASGDTLVLKTGTYTETGLTPPSGTPGAHTIIRSASGATVTFNSTGPFNLFDTGRQYIDIVGTCTTGLSRTCSITFTGNTVNNIIAFRKVIDGGSNNILFDGVRVTANSYTAINIASTNITFRNCRVDNNGRVLDASSQAGYAFYIGGDNNTVEYCELDNNGGYGIHQYSSDQNPANNTYRFNFIHNNGQTVAPSNNADGILLNGNGGNTNNKAYGNVIWGNRRGYGVEVNDASNAVVHDNTIYDNGADVGANGISINAGSTNTSIKNNIVSANNNSSSTQITNSAGGQTTFATNLCSAAGTGCAVNEVPVTTFTNAGANNFTLLPGSLALNTGTALGSPYDTDILNVPRPQGSGWDIGAYETSSGVVIPAIVITSPTSSDTLTTSSATLSTLSGTATNAASVAWTCDRCTVTFGNAVGTSTWTVPTLTLKAGINIITVTATSASSGTATDTLTITYAPTFPGNSLVLALPFENGSGATATDMSGNANHATLVNTPTWAGASGGRYGNGIIFDGLTQYATVADSNSLDMTQSFTISLWVKPSASNTDYRAILLKNASGIAAPYEFYASVAGLCGSGGIAGFSNVNGVSGPQNNACYATPLQPATWTHLAFTYDGATLKLYIQGVLRASQIHVGYMEPSTGILNIARGTSTEYFQGAMDELRIYNYAIPATALTNTVFGASCVRGDQNTTPSVIGDANCSIVPLSPPVAFKLSSTSTIKLGADKSLKIQGTVP